MKIICEAGMRVISRIACLLLLGTGIMMPVILSSQPQQSLSAPGPSVNAGRRAFMQNCSYCHLPRGNPKDPAKKTFLGANLSGLFRKEKPPSDEAVRQFVLHGVPEKMPGFQYGLNAKEVDDLIAYLKTL